MVSATVFSRIVSEYSRTLMDCHGERGGEGGRRCGTKSAYRHTPLHGDLTFLPVAVSEQVLQSRANLGNMLGMLAG
jgi:hypothetical protein